jgi:adenylosuccinate synthase
MITIITGAQFGGEGKGKIAAYLAWKEGASVACRCGGPNSSHTVIWNGRTYRLRMLPTAAVIIPDIQVYFGAGTLIHIPTLWREIKDTAFRGRLVIDPQAGIVTDEIIRQQRADGRYAILGSTLTGTGYANAQRCMRSLPLAREFPELKERAELAEVSQLVYARHRENANILVEGHQGFGLSNYHGDYPFTSSRDSTASSMLAEIGLGPIQKNLRVVLATKMFPTRNHAGSVGQELASDEAAKLGIAEYGGGAWDLPNRRRRVGMLDVDIVRRAVIANSASEIALTGIDYLCKEASGASDFDRLSDESKEELEDIFSLIEGHTGVPVRYLSTGPETESTFDRTSEESRDIHPDLAS